MRITVKKVLSLALCLVMLFSCLVFTSSQAVALGAQKQSNIEKEQTYCVRVLIVEDRDFSFDPASDNIAYQNTELWEDYATVTYKSMNGTGTEGSVSFNLGDQDDGSKSIGARYNIVSGGGDDYGYYPSDEGVEIPGFPTSAFCNYRIKNKAKGGFYAYLQIAKKTDSGWDWSDYGTCTDRGIGAFGINAGGSISSAYKKSIGDTVGHVTLTEAANPGAGTDINCTVNVPVSCYPYASSNLDASFNFYAGNIVNNTVSCPAKAADAAIVRTVRYSSPLDQYGVEMLPSVAIAGEVSTNGISVNADKISVTSEANLSGEHNSQQLYVQLTWVQKDKTYSEVYATNTMTVTDAQYPVNWYDHSNSLIGTTQVYFGDLPSFEVPHRPFNASVHYVGGAWSHPYEAVSENSNNAYTAVYEQAEHSYSSFEYVDTTYHKGMCAVDADDVHYQTQEHSFTETVVNPTCTDRGYTRHRCEQCGYYYDTDRVNELGHKWDKGVVTTEPECEKSGVMTYTCTVCNSTKTEPVSSLGHSYKLNSFTAPKDGVDGSGAYFSCERCNSAYWTAEYNEEYAFFDLTDETEYETAEQAAAKSDFIVPSPAFNTFNNTQLGYDYSLRGASLKYSDLKLPVIQPMRFMGSVKVPTDVNWQIGAEGDAVVDVGYVYTQAKYITDESQLELGKDHVFSMSVLEENERSDKVYNGSNWGGISKHEEGGNVYLSFNLVIEVEFGNWKEDYSARPYIKYNYKGMEFTVYDSMFTSRSVAYIAGKVVQNEKESDASRAYCQSVILDNLKSL